MKLLFIIISALFIQAASAEDEFTECNYCSASAMKLKAQQQQSLQSIMHVVSKPNRLVRSYSKEIVEGFGDTFFVDVRQVATSASAMNDILDTLDYIDLLKAEMEDGVNVEDLPGMPPGFPGSALELINVPSNMQMLNNGVASWLASQQDVGGGLSVVGALFQSATDLAGEVVKVTFPDDDSTYVFKVIKVDVTSSGNPYFTIEPIPHSGKDGDNNPIPETVSDLQNMSITVENSNSGGSLNAWQNLFQNLGVGFSSTTGAGSSTSITCYSTGPTSFRCEAVQSN